MPTSALSVLDRAIEEPGTARALAIKLEVAFMAISQWRVGGLPAKWVRPIVATCYHVVCAAQLCPSFSEFLQVATHHVVLAIELTQINRRTQYRPKPTAHFVAPINPNAHRILCGSQTSAERAIMLTPINLTFIMCN